MRTTPRHSRRRPMAVGTVLAAAVVAVGSVAWACVPGPTDMQTRVSTCNPPAGATRPCKTPVGAPKFPDATFVKGPSGSRVVAYVNGPGPDWPTSYDLVFASKPQLERGMPCASSESVEIGGPVTTTSSTISPTAGTIPPDAPLGLSQICFADIMRGQTGNDPSTPAQFKVTV